MKYLIIALSALLSACGGGESRQDDIEIASIEICLDQGGEWLGYCLHEHEYCAKESCKVSGSCACLEYRVKDWRDQKPKDEEP